MTDGIRSPKYYPEKKNSFLPYRQVRPTIIVYVSSPHQHAQTVRFVGSEQRGHSEPVPVLFTNREFTPCICPLFCCKDPNLVALLELGLLTTPCHFLRLFDLLGRHV